MGQTRTSHWLLVRDFDDGQVVIMLPKREERHLEILQKGHQFHPHRFGVEGDRPLGIPYSEHRVADTNNSCHILSPLA
jgi:hypothetical protein